ncbi:MAG: MATE family efflux transporter [Acidimicrobiales bacterium]
MGGLPVAAAVAVAARPLAGLLGGDGAVLDAAVTYLRISAAGIPMVLVALVGHGYLRGVADTRTPLLVVVAANAVNVVLELALVYGLDLGVAGSAWSTVIAQTGAAAWFLVLLRRRLVVAGAVAAANRAEMAGLLSAGRRLFVRTGSLLATVALATSVAARLGPATLAGHQIALQVHLLLAMVLDALAVPGQILVATALGAGDPGAARTAADRLLRIGVVLGLALGTVTLAVSPLLPHLFTTDTAVADRAAAALVVVAVAQLPSAAAFVLDGVLVGAADFGFLQWSLLGGLALFVPLAVVVTVWPSVGIVGLWCGLLAWMVYRAGANALRYRAAGWAAQASAAPAGTAKPARSAT